MSTSTRTRGPGGAAGLSNASMQARIRTIRMGCEERKVRGRGQVSPDERALGPLVLFICTGNYYRSRFAEALFNHHARQRSLRWRAFSRGTALFLPQGAISPHVVEGLARRGVDVSDTSPAPTRLTGADFERAARHIALYEPEHRPVIRTQFPEWEARVIYWRVPDLGEMEPEEGLAMIEAKVVALLDELGGQGRGGSHGQD